MDAANLVVYLLDLQEVYEEESLLSVVKAIEELNKEVVVVGNKIDQANPDTLALCRTYFPALLTISAKENVGIATLIERLLSFVKINSQTTSDVVVSNVRHLEALKLALEALTRAYNGLHQGLTGDFLALDIRHGLYHIGSITGEVTSEDLLGYIFGSFCIGK
jgi:tRNA modification GTPase